jgi:hypothetical protein
MERKSATLNLVGIDLKGSFLFHKRLPTLLAGLMILLLAVVAVMGGMSLFGPGASSRIAAGVDAASARWSALGASYTPDYEAVAAVSSARYTVLAESYELSAARSADSARWSALGASYAPDYEAIAAVSSARWSALAESYTDKAAQGQ